MNKKQYKLYRHILRKEISGYEFDKYYYGLTKQKNINQRWRNGEGYKTQEIYKDIKKFGWSNIEHEIIFDNLSLEEGELLEKMYIVLYNTTNEKFGYNLQGGGMSSFEIHEKSKKKMSENHYDCSGNNNPNYGKHLSEETKDKISRANKGNTSPMKNKKHTDESKKKMSENSKGKISPNRTKVINLDTGEIFDSITEARKKYPKATHISHVCIGERKRTGGYRWAYYNKK